jgi:hypothetical protein
MNRLATFLSLLLLAGPAQAEPPAPSCDSCAAFNETQQPFRIFGNAYYVGVRGLSSVLITSSEGHVLIDGDLPESAQKIAASLAVRAHLTPGHTPGGASFSFSPCETAGCLTVVYADSLNPGRGLIRTHRASGTGTTGGRRPARATLSSTRPRARSTWKRRASGSRSGWRKSARTRSISTITTGKP